MQKFGRLRQPGQPQTGLEGTKDQDPLLPKVLREMARASTAPGFAPEDFVELWAVLGGDIPAVEFSRSTFGKSQAGRDADPLSGEIP